MKIMYRDKSGYDLLQNTKPGRSDGKEFFVKLMRILCTSGILNACRHLLREKL